MFIKTDQGVLDAADIGLITADDNMVLFHRKNRPAGTTPYSAKDVLRLQSNTPGSFPDGMLGFILCADPSEATSRRDALMRG